MSGEPPADQAGTAPALEISEDGTWRPAPAPPPPAAVPFPAAPPPEPTGEEKVDAALGRLAELARLPVSEHVAVFEDVHRRVQDVLTSVDQETAGPPTPRPPGPGIVPARPDGRP